MTIHVMSNAFGDGQTIPQKHTGDGEDISPPLQWSSFPENTQSFALICDDPDAPHGTWVHWVLYNLPADQHHLAEHVPAGESELSHGARQGKNDFGHIGYGGPAPPKGNPHRYFFKVFALAKKLDLSAGATKNQLESAMKGHILAEGHLIGKYQR